MEFGLDRRNSVTKYMSGPLFRAAFHAALTEFCDLEVAFSHALRVLYNIGPNQKAVWGYIIPGIFGVHFDPSEANDIDLASISSLEEFIEVIDKHPDAFFYDVEGLLASAIKFGSSEGHKAIPAHSPIRTLAFDLRKVMASLHYAMFISSEMDIDFFDDPADSPWLLASAVETAFREIFEPIDGRYFLESHHCASSACRGFWKFLGLWTDEHGRPLMEW